MAGLASASILTSTSDFLLDAFAAPAAPTPGFRLVDVTAPSGIKFRHNSGAYGGTIVPETPGARCAIFYHSCAGWKGTLLARGPIMPGDKIEDNIEPNTPDPHAHNH